MSASKMTIGPVDIEVINRVIQAVASGLRRAEDETPDGRKVTGYWISDSQIRIDLVEHK